MENPVWIKYYENGILKDQLTFVEADRRIELKVGELTEAGVRSGDRVIVKIQNSPLAVVTYLALYKLGAVVVPVHYKETDSRVDFIIANCNARALISVDGIRILQEALNDDSSPLSAISTIVYTSGTTGDPKGVCLGWDNWIENAQALIKHHALDEKSVFASLLLLSHCNAHGLAMIATYTAKSTWILFDKVVPNLLNIVFRERVQILSIVPAILYQLHRENKNWVPNKEFKYILTAAVPLSPSLLSEVLGDWGIRVVQGYGLSESTNFSCTMPTNLDMDLYKKIMFPLPSVGVSLAGVTIKVGEKDEPDVAGEITISSKSNCKGYWGRGASSSPMQQIMTGDIGYYKVIEGQRFYYLIGRAKEIINRGGEKISPVELEIELRDAGMVGEFAVITIPSDMYGEDVGLAFAGDLDFAPLTKIPSYRRPKSIFRITDLFYTPTGKLQRKKLSDFCNSGQAALIQT